MRPRPPLPPVEPFSTPEAAQADPPTPLGPDQIILRELSARGRVLRGGVQGFALTFRHRSGGTLARQVRFTATLTSAKGQPVTVALAGEGFGDRGAPLKARCARAAGAGPATEEIFVPFYVMDLPPGAQVLRGELGVAALSPTEGDAPGRWERLELIGEGRFELELEVPRALEVRLGVKSVDVAPGEYDGLGEVTETVKTLAGVSLSLEKRLDLPDLKWAIARGGADIYWAQVRGNTLRATWREKTPWFRLSEGDLISVQVVDSDLVDNDELAELLLSLDDIAERARQGEAFSSGKVTRLVIGPPERR